MSSRKNPKPAPTAPPPQGLQLKPPTVRLWMIVICLGLLAGVLAGVIAYFIYPTGISVGTFNTTMPAPVAAAVTDRQLFATYAGAAACRECHAKEYDLWSNSHHGLAERATDPAIDATAFDPPRTFEHGSQKTQVRVNNGRHGIVKPRSVPAPTPHPAPRAIGPHPHPQFLTA